MNDATGRFVGRAALVTGGASGIGAATAQRLAYEGARVVVVDRDDQKGAALAERIGARFVRADLAEAEQVEAAARAAAEHLGRLDILVNNAGTGGTGGATPEVAPETWRRVMAVNLDAVFYMCRAVIPLMRGSGGVIVNTASISGLRGDYGFTVYNASKAAVINYTRSLALDHAREGIRVNAVCPGLIATGLTEPLGQAPETLAHWHELIPLGRSGTPEEVAALIAFLASDEAAYVTGAAFVVDGGISAATGQPNLPALRAKSQQ